MPPPLQAKLLRFLEDRSLRRVGGTEEIAPDVRVIAATHVNLREAVAERRFRQDLFYRLAVVEISMPPLRDRPEDIEGLARHFLVQLDCPECDLEPEALRKLEAHPWPGNVRELRNVIERAVSLAPGRVLSPADVVLQPPGPRLDRFALPPEGIDLDALERDLLVQALERTKGNRTRAAQLLGLGRDAVRYRIAKHHLDD